MPLIELGDKLTVSTKTGFRANHSYPSRVGEVLDEHNFLIEAPIFKGQVINFPIYKEYVFVFYTQNGLLQANGVITEYLTQDRVTLMKIKVGEFEQIQRREYYRVNVTLPFSYTLMQTPDDPDSAENPPVFRAVTKNISGKGICFTTDEPLYVNEHILCRLSFENAFLTVEGIVLSSESSGNTKNNYTCRLAFVNIDGRQQDEIIKYVMKIERGIIFGKKIKSEERKRGGRQ